MDIEPNQLQNRISINPQKIEQEAANWFAKIQGARLTQAENEFFLDWLDANPAHRKAYLETENYWRSQIFADALAQIPLSSAKSHRQPNKHRRFARMALAAGVLFAIFIVQDFRHCLNADYCTTTGETRSVSLADGSAVTLAPDSAIRVSLQSQTRHIQLVKGEAFFDVRRNPEQAFVVDSHFSQTRVLGTQFIVRENPASDTVTVVHGVVSVSQPHGQPAMLKASDQITISAENAEAITQVSATKFSAWAKGHLVFENATLADVASELNRYRRGLVIVKNDRLKKLKISGRFSLSEPYKALDALEQTLPIRVYRITPLLTIIT
jgi:transmembrane sensor